MAACLLGLLLSACEVADPLERVRQRQALGYHKETLEPLRELLAERRDDGEVNYLYGVALMAIGEYGAATWPLRQALEDPEWRVPAALYLIRTALFRQDYKEVVDLADRLLEDDPDDAVTLLYRAQARAYQKWDLEAAVADARRALVLQPDLLEAYEPLIIALLGLERYEAAREELAEAGRRLEETDAPESTLAWHCSTSAIFAFEKDPEHPEQAEEVWNECLERFPADPTVVANAAEYFDGRGKPSRALEVLERAHELEPELWSFRAGLAYRLAASGDPAAGEALLLEATEVEDPPLAHAAWLDVADFRNSLGDHARAADAIERAIELLREVEEPRPLDLFRWADTLVISGQFDRALEVADRIGVPAQTALIRARVAQEQGDPTAALEFFDEALRLWPDNPWAHYYAALAAEAAGRFGRALEEYRYAIRIDPSATDGRTRAAKLLAAQGLLVRAYQILFVEVAKHPLEPEGKLFGVYLLARAANPSQLQDSLLRLAREEVEKLPEALAHAAVGVEERVGSAAAVELLRDAPVIDYESPRSFPALRELVRLAHASGQPEVAGQAVEKALAAEPEAAAFQTILGLHLELGGQPEEARAAYRQALVGWPRNPAALLGLGRLTLPSDPGEAAQLFHRAALADPSDPEPTVRLARILRAAGELEPARARLKELLEESPFDAVAAAELAEIDLSRGEVSVQTLAWAQRALALEPGPKSLERLQRVHEALGNTEQAEELAERLRDRLAAREEPGPE